MITRHPSNVKSSPLLCKSMRELHNIMLPNKRKNIINRKVSRIEEWFTQN